jgi:hypothetical protein
MSVSIYTFSPLPNDGSAAILGQDVMQPCRPYHTKTPVVMLRAAAYSIL